MLSQKKPPIQKTISFIVILFLTIMTTINTQVRVSAANNPTSIDLIPTGAYFIETKFGKVIDIKDGSQDDGATLQIWDKSNTPQQIFIIEKVNADSYKIIPYHSNKPLEVRDYSHEDGADIAQWSNHSSKSQLWKIEYTDDDKWYKFVNVESGKCMDIAGGNLTNGTNIQQYEWNATNAQKFRILSAENNQPVSLYNKLFDFSNTRLSSISYFLISPKISDKMSLDIENISKDNGARLQIWEKHSTIQEAEKNGNQRFFISQTGTGTVKITPYHSDKPLEVRNSSHDIGAEVAQWERHSNKCQEWYMVKLGSNSYKFINAESYMCMDVSAGYTYNGTKIQQYWNNETNSQIFNIMPVYH